ncbi:concanavalin A-like lectin/glucanase [Mollisia scopiformis]|uniref:Concanavalin A-like lectin/glucanase n=1 Tax=Mollisia scopiformis TaxID=149040 RepID=A0A194XCU9_MOLSC|nr:concanavalin A-like lectin/glucanase [Mollisia scopiformis]KUJ18000.1 concanavalin A-like lectin/glucanase [Mollisia scopiformis]
MAPETNAGFNIIWSDDFSSGSLDMTKWDRFTAAPSNGEQETYPSSGNNCQLTSAQTLLITPENSGGAWTSCRIESLPSFQAKAGGQIIVQSRFKLGSPGANLQGIWPAFWSLGEAVRNGVSWPACGEIDTFENIDGGALGYGTLHCGAACNDPTGLTSGIAFDYGTFHTWAHAIDLRSGDWTQQSITWYMDGQAYHVIHGSDVGNAATWTAVAQSGMFITLNVAVGGGWPGNAAGNTASGQAAGMEVQYVAVYESA